MTEFVRPIEMVRLLVPDVDDRIGPFEIEPFDLEDDILEVFREELDRLGGDLDVGLDPFDVDQVKRAAHSMNGMCGAMGLPEISVLAQEIEITLRAGDRERCAFLSNALIAWARDFIAI